MVASYGSAERISSQALTCTQDLASSPEAAFALLCAVPKWPNWLSFLKSAHPVEPDAPLRLGSEIVLRSAIPGHDEELYEVDQYLEGHILSLVGAYSVRRRIDFRIERKTGRSKMLVRVDYPAYGGLIGALVDRVTARRRLETALAASLQQFKSIVEYTDVEHDPLLADF